MNVGAISSIIRGSVKANCIALIGWDWSFPDVQRLGSGNIDRFVLVQQWSKDVCHHRRSILPARGVHLFYAEDYMFATAETICAVNDFANFRNV